MVGGSGRNRIKTPTGLLWLTVPVVCSGGSCTKAAQPLEDVEAK